MGNAYHVIGQMIQRKINIMNEKVSGTLNDGEFHPAAHIAMQFIRDNFLRRFDTGTPVGLILESLASCALSGNRLAEVVHETLRRIIHGEPVSDRYLMGAAWMIWQMEQGKKDE